MSVAEGPAPGAAGRPEAAGVLATDYNGRDFSLRLRAAAPPGYPTVRRPDLFVEAAPSWEGRIAYRAAYQARRRAYLAFCLGNPAPANLKAPFYELPRIAAGAPPHEGILHAALDYIEERRDCADFIAHAFLRLLFQFPDSPNVTRELYVRVEDVLLGFKYWPSEPGLDSLCTWTENHQILYASLAYLLGRRRPEATFTNSGLSGAELAAAARPRILRWLDLRFRSGFSEWLSNVYYDEDLTALLSLADFADDEIAQRANAVACLLLLDLAQNSVKGVFGSSHGRSYEAHKKDARAEATCDTAKLLWGCGAWTGADNMAAPCLALSLSFEPPAILAAVVAAEGCAEIRSRMGIRVDEASKWGLGYDELEDGMVFLSLEAYNHPKTIDLTFRMFDEYRWWDNEYFAPFAPYRKPLALARRLSLLPAIARAFEGDVNRNAREEVNLYSYRTPDYMLSCAQDYRFRKGGDQQSLWQATLGPSAVCFTTHPGGMGGNSPDYWTGTGSMPRVAQYRNLLVALYDIDTRPGLYRRNRLLYTHAWLPEGEFDEVVAEKLWYFARRGKAYLALRSREACDYIPDRCPGGVPAAPPASPSRAASAGRRNELLAEGRRNVWICRLGREAEEGSFAEFRAAICGARLVFGAGLRVEFEDPNHGRAEFGARGPLLVRGREIPLRDYPRYDAPWARADFPADRVELACGGERLVVSPSGVAPRA